MGEVEVELHFRHVRFRLWVNSKLKMFIKKPPLASDIFDNKDVLGRFHIHEKQIHRE